MITINYTKRTYYRLYSLFIQFLKNGENFISRGKIKKEATHFTYG